MSGRLTTKSLCYCAHQGGGLVGVKGIEMVENAAKDSVVKMDKGRIGVWVDREMFGDWVGGGVEHEAVAGERAEDGERVFGIVGNVCIEKDEDVGKKVGDVEGVGVLG